MTHRLHLISFSGGIGSAVSCLLAHEHNLNYEMLFADTGIEDEDLHRFSKDIENAVGKKIAWMSCGKNPWDVYAEKKYIGNSRTAHCSTVLKTEVVRQYIYDFYIDSNPILVLGMSLEEIERIERAKQKWKPVEVESLLIRYRCNSRQAQEEKIASYGIKLPRLYDYGFPHNNCGGFCCKAGLTQFATLLRHFPERFAWHEEQEDKTFKAIGATARPFLRKVIDGKTHYLRLSEFRKQIEAGQLDVPSYDYGGCSCFTDEE